MTDYNMNKNNVNEEKEYAIDFNKIKFNYDEENIVFDYKSFDIPMNNAIFSLMLYPESANLFCSYGDITTYVHQKEHMFFMDENEVMLMHIPYKKGLHLLKCLGYEKVSVSIMPFDVSIDDDEEPPKAIYYAEDWKRVE